MMRICPFFFICLNCRPMTVPFKYLGMIIGETLELFLIGRQSVKKLSLDYLDRREDYYL